MLAVHFGAGNIGRGFIGALLSKAGYETVFVDVNGELIDQINERRKYTIELAGSKESFEVTNIAGINSVTNQEDVVAMVAKADLITTAVGPHILPKVAPLIAEGLKERTETVNVIACENMIGGSDLLKEHVLKHLDEEFESRVVKLTGFPNAAVDRIVPDQTHENPLKVTVEPYFEWVVDSSNLKGEKPGIGGMTLVDDLTPYIERKLFTVNTGHAAAAYLGNYYGHQTIHQAMSDSGILSKIKGALHESGDVLIKKYGFTKETHGKYIETILSRFANPDLSDEVTRVGRAPIRKLGPKDRLVRPAVEYIEWNKEIPIHLVEVIAAVLVYEQDQDPEAVELQSLIKEQGYKEALQEVAQLSEDHPLLEAVEKQF
ncbi:mannitol-1-phosphate 5-dehydrogenase [Halobacillus shinanisalinarum]|uniref:Mannitol-1-phosphate 5-dehydrogenase n=1 Tax=Halobacillus shinanisalinarum TaxID=2932258 RepID=A0ABY4GWN4_9BACI|nr:mannitol-1-phosphate 5-dehydrogenase [Halobacillus shinanisalinarum]UOQ92548.1 mannitol-1-phosphate 5-dehydrogenase [Halobacillus shinanisalinarum]